MIHLTTYIFEKCKVWAFQRRAGRPHRVSTKDFPSLSRKLSQYTTNSLIFWRPSFLQKCIFFVFCRNFGFNLEKLSNHYSQLKKHLKVDPETRSYDFLTKTREKNPMSRNILISSTTLGCHLNITLFERISFMGLKSDFGVHSCLANNGPYLMNFTTIEDIFNVIL